MSGVKYKQRIDYEGFEVPSGEKYKIACCDCGLVHEFVFVSEDGKPIGIAARRDQRATGQRRRKLSRFVLQSQAPSQSDSERLDYLEEKQKCLYTVFNTYRKYRTDGLNGVDVTQEFSGWCVGTSEEESKTAREAIDAARAKEPTNE